MVAALHGRAQSPSPRSYGERVGVRGSSTLRRRRKPRPLTLALSPLKSGERGSVAPEAAP